MGLYSGYFSATDKPYYEQAITDMGDYGGATQKAGSLARRLGIDVGAALGTGSEESRHGAVAGPLATEFYTWAQKAAAQARDEALQMELLNRKIEAQQQLWDEADERQAEWERRQMDPTTSEAFQRARAGALRDVYSKNIMAGAQANQINLPTQARWTPYQDDRGGVSYGWQY